MSITPLETTWVAPSKEFETRPAAKAERINKAIISLNGLFDRLPSSDISIPSIDELLGQEQSNIDDSPPNSLSLSPEEQLPLLLDWLIYTLGSDSALKKLQPEQRIAFIGLSFDFLETSLHSDANFTPEYINNFLTEITFKTRDMVVNDPEIDDLAILTSHGGGRNAMLLYLAVEHSHASVFDKSEDKESYPDDGFSIAHEIIEEINHTSPRTARLLQKKLAEAQEMVPYERRLSDEMSASHLKASVLSEAGSSEWRERAEKTKFSLTIGATIDTALEIFKEFGGIGHGRLLSALDFAHSGGSTLSGLRERSASYNMLRKKIEKEQLGYESNLFFPNLIYGALNPDCRPDKANGYGDIAFHIRRKGREGEITYTLGDSVPRNHSKVHLTRVNEQEAKQAALYNEEENRTSRNNYSTEVPYIEAQIPGVFIDDIEMVSASLNRYNAKQAQGMIKALQSALQAGIKVSVDFWWDTEAMKSFNKTEGATRMNLGDRIRYNIDPSGKLWDKIDVRMIDMVPQTLSKEEIIDRYTQQGVEVIYFHEIKDIKP